VDVTAIEPVTPCLQSRCTPLGPRIAANLKNMTLRPALPAFRCCKVARYTDSRGDVDGCEPLPAQAPGGSHRASCPPVNCYATVGRKWRLRPGRPEGRTITGNTFGIIAPS
jgi:hypothetical protein